MTGYPSNTELGRVGMGLGVRSQYGWVGSSRCRADRPLRHLRMSLAGAQAGSLCYWTRCLGCPVIPARRTLRHPRTSLAGAQAGSLCYWTRCLDCPVIPARRWRGPMAWVTSASRQPGLREAGGRVGRRCRSSLSYAERSVRRPYRDPGRAGAWCRARGLDPASATSVRTWTQGRSARSPTRPPGVPAAFARGLPPSSPDVVGGDPRLGSPQHLANRGYARPVVE